MTSSLLRDGIRVGSNLPHKDFLALHDLSPTTGGKTLPVRLHVKRSNRFTVSLPVALDLRVCPVVHYGGWIYSDHQRVFNAQGTAIHKEAHRRQRAASEMIVGLTRFSLLSPCRRENVIAGC
jgi:hypothetical protein